MNDSDYALFDSYRIEKFPKLHHEDPMYKVRAEAFEYALMLKQGENDELKDAFVEQGRILTHYKSLAEITTHEMENFKKGILTEETNFRKKLAGDMVIAGLQSGREMSDNYLIACVHMTDKLLSELKINRIT